MGNSKQLPEAEVAKDQKRTRGLKVVLAGVHELSKAWKTISNTNAALRRLEEKLDVGPTRGAVCDPFMETKKPPSSTMRKVSRKDGRYSESSNNYISKSSNPSKAGREKLSRSPLRATTLESNVKKTSHVVFREPLASYRDSASALSTAKERSTVRLSSGLNAGGSEERDFDSTRSSAVDDTAVRFLNDQPAIDALEWRVLTPHSGASEFTFQTDYARTGPLDAAQQSLSFSPSSNRLEALKRRQPDPKLDKLKERIRRQWELSGERHAGDRIPSTTNFTETISSVKTRKVTSAPPPPVYPGFNPAEMKVRTPDGKLLQEEEFKNLSPHLHASLMPTSQDIYTNDDKSRSKRPSRPVRKVQRLPGGVGTGSPENKSGHIISTSSWRDGQKLVKQILGPAPKAEKSSSKNMSTDRHDSKLTLSVDGQLDRKPKSAERDARKRTVSTERQKDRQTVKRSLSKETQDDDRDRSTTSQLHDNIDKSARDPSGNTKSHVLLDENKHQTEPTDVKTDFLPLEIRGILNDLQLDSTVDVAKQTRSRSHSPTKRKPDKAHLKEEPPISSKKRHYDTEQVRQYILRQQEERKKKQKEQKEAQRQAEEQKNKRLQELYQKQKEAFSKARSVAFEQHESIQPIPSQSLDPSAARPQDLRSTLLLGQAWPDLSEQEKQVKPLYQPSGESDKENKCQERPPSASSSSDLSLSEPLQPLLRSDLMDTYCLQPDRLISKGSLPQSQSAGGTGMLSQLFTLPRDVESLIHLKKTTSTTIPETQRKGLQGKMSSNFRSNLDRIENLKATAVSLSSRIENEAKKLAGGSPSLPSNWNADVEPKHEIKTAWKKPDSPPEREASEDIFSARLQRMLGTCTSNFSQRDLPGANSLYKMIPDDFHQVITSPGICEVRNEETPLIQTDRLFDLHHNISPKASPSQISSTSSISEGPLLSEGSLSEGEGASPHAGSPINPAETLRNKEFCARDSSSYAPLVEFQREATKYPPLSSSNIGSQVRGPWEELSKGSPHSVINIFTKSYQLFGKGLDEQSGKGSPEIQPPYGPASSQDSVSYVDDFISPSASESTSDIQKVLQQSVDSNASSIKEELPLVKSRSEVASSHSSGSRSAASSPGSSSSQRLNKHRKGQQNLSSQNSLVRDHSSSGSEHRSQGNKRSPTMSPPGKERLIGSDATESTIGELSPRSMSSEISLRSNRSSVTDAVAQPPMLPRPPTTPGLGVHASVAATGSDQGTMRFSPAVLHQRMSTELNYLSAMEESVRQLCDMERARGISLAQQETISLAQILKAQQQRHEQNMAALRQQAEQEAQESLRQLEEARQKAAQTHTEMLQRFQKTMETSAPQKTKTQEEMDRGSVSSISPEPTVTSLVDLPNRVRQHGTRKKGSSPLLSSQSSSSPSSFGEPPHRGTEQHSESAPVMEATVSHSEVEESISEELPSLSRSTLEEKSVSFENKETSSADPVSEEGIEEQSFRSLLPSEAHRRGSLERQRSHRHESDEESTPEKELSGPFSSGQDSFWRFTMEMVRQYMQEGEMRSAHQAALLRLRQKALKDKTKAELAWLEHQKRRLRDKGEDDKMPPLRKRQRGLLLRLQQEQAEIKRLQEANKAARRERQLILKQQEEIQRIQNSTLRLQEKLKSAENGQLELPSEGDVQPSPASTRLPSDAESRSPSPVSVSGSETSSIMQKLRKMHSHMDAKDICPVHCFFSVFTPQHWASLSVCFPKLHPKFQLYICRQLLRFLTKREQQLVQRRLHAQELLEWKKRLDAEEIEIRRIEKQALAAWDNQRAKTKSPEVLNTTEEQVSIEGSPGPLSSTIPTKAPGSPTSAYVPSETVEHSSIAEQLEQSEAHSSISEEVASSLHSNGSTQKQSKSLNSGKESLKSAAQQAHITLRPHQLSQTWSEESLSVAHSETTSDQSDIECRIKALKDELRKRKSVVDNLKKEQKRRHKERLKAQEAILLKQLQSYDEFILKTQAELSREQGAVPNAKSSAQTTVDSREPVGVIPESIQSSDGTPTYNSANENEHHVEPSTKDFGIFSQETSQKRRRETEAESFLKQSVQGLPSLSANEDVGVHEPRSPSHRDNVSYSTHSSPVSSIHSEVPEEMLETRSDHSVSPLPVLSLNLKSPTTDENLQREHSYSEDFEESSPTKHSVGETPRDERELSYATTPGRDLPSEVLDEHDEEHLECRSSSPILLELLETTPASEEPKPSIDMTNPLADFQLGDRVLVSGVQPGILRYKGETHFAKGVWAGVELDKSEGNNDGAHEGKRYFSCLNQHGIFAPPHKISHLLVENENLPESEDHISPDKKYLEPKEELDGFHSPTFGDVPENNVLEISSLKSNVSSASEVSTKALEEQFHPCDLNVDISEQISADKEDSLNPQLPLLDILDSEKQQLTTVRTQALELNSLSESLLKFCLKDTVTCLQNIRKQRADKILQSNQDLQSSPTTSDIQSDNDTPNEDLHLHLVPAYDTISKQDLEEFEPSHNLLTVLGEEPDWFDEDFGLSSRKAQKREIEKSTSAELTPEPCLVVPLPEPAPKPILPVPQPEPLMAVPHTVPEVEQLVQVAADELWRWKQLGGDLQKIRASYTQAGEEDHNTAVCAYKAIVFDLTLQIFDDICSPDPRGSQPPWKKPPRVSPLYARRVRDPHNIEEVKSFLTDEVLSLLSLKKTHNHKTDWQRMMKFGRKKRDRVDHILVQELHEEEAQWVNYDEDELFVKMQLADGIFDALIRDTVQVLHRIQEKKNVTLLV
ncbi:centrosome-associated protein 350 isoform X2 [Pelobates fuscus]|uniref:centrosome-associated protein 350 isoform X2 n=1 Tax=Pelobates fuscus TaxID=191477 RepID=UPI002FE4E526